VSVRTFTLALAAASSMILAPLPAYAETITTHDAANDVVSQGLDDEEATTPEPGRTEGDVLSMRVLHGPRNVRVTLRVAQLSRTKGLTAAHSFSFRTNEGRRADLILYVTDGDWQGQQMWEVNGKDRTCHGLRTHIDYSAATVRAVVPRRCLSNPRWVRVGGGDGMLEGDELYADDVNRSGTVGFDAKLGPRVHRG
jgi:hypothetical protein